MLAFGRSPLIPGQLLGHPGPPLTSLQTKALLEEMYKLESNPALPTSSKQTSLDISHTDDATHVYIKVDEPKGLCPRFEGPFKVISRPSRSQIQVRLGSYANGEPRLATYHWHSCKPAYVRPDFVEGSRPKLGRRPNPTTTESQLANKQTLPDESAVANASQSNHETSSSERQQPSSIPAERGKIQKAFDPLSGRDTPWPSRIKVFRE